MSKKPIMEHIGDFIAGKGFYIVLFLCVAAIGISGYYLFSSLGSGTEDVAADAPAQVVVTPAPSAAPTPGVKPTPTPTPQPTATPTPRPTATPAPTPAAEANAGDSQSAMASPVFTWPVKGEIIRDFSLEVLAYDETMGDWRTHCGLDVAADLGTQVWAVSAGTVEQVFQDDLMGATVVIDHGGGLKSLYANLAATPTVEAGDHVSTGDVIGAVGETSLAESGKPAHLHLEMSTDGAAVDPLRYLPK